MKIVVTCILIFSLKFLPAYSQDLPSDNNFIMPIFLDSLSFIKEVEKDEGIRNMYKLLQQENDYITYKYDFNITCLGKIKPGNFEDDKVFKTLNKFIKSKLNKYKWHPAHIKGCPKCFRVSYGTLNINIIPFKNIVQVQILISDGSAKKIYGEMVYDKSVIIK